MTRKYSKWIFQLLVHGADVLLLNLDARAAEKFQALRRYSQEDDIRAFSNVFARDAEPPARSGAAERAFECCALEVYSVFREVSAERSEVLILTHSASQFNYLRSLGAVQRFRVRRLGGAKQTTAPAPWRTCWCSS